MANTAVKPFEPHGTLSELISKNQWMAMPLDWVLREGHRQTLWTLKPMEFKPPSIDLAETLPLPGRWGTRQESPPVNRRSFLAKGWRRRCESAPRISPPMVGISLPAQGARA